MEGCLSPPPARFGVRARCDGGCVALARSRLRAHAVSLAGGRDAHAVSLAGSSPRERTSAPVAIGPAGEKLVRYACVVNDFSHCAGRMGMGAVMGSKNLKAVAVRVYSTLLSAAFARNLVAAMLEAF